MEKISKNFALILNVVCLLLLLFLIFKNYRTPKFKHVDMEQEFEEIKLKQDSLQEKLFKLKLEEDSILNKIHINQIEKTIIKNFYHEKISSVDTISDNSLKLFFTERYQ